jgi:cell wall-associated NlpC family hydrolase
MWVRVVATAAAVAVAAVVLTVSAGHVATSAEPPPGGCAITTDTPHQAVGKPASGTTSAVQKDAELNAAQMAAARTIAGIGAAKGIAPRGIAIALGTAMQESTLDPAATNGRSVGLYQQQGQLYQHVNRTDPADAAAAFYDVLRSRVPTYADPAAGTFADIAQEVQRSGAGAIKYAQWESWATALADQLINGPDTDAVTGPGAGVPGEVVCEPGGGAGPLEVSALGTTLTLPGRAGISGQLRFPHPAAATAAAAALSYLGTPYAWGGGTPAGPSKGIRDGGVADTHGDYNKIGFDCSGLTEYAYAQAGIPIGVDSRTQRAIGGPVHPYTQALPGDLLFWGGPSQRAIHHVALYLGTINGTAYMVEAPRSGDVVKVSVVRTGGGFRNEAIRPWA